MKWLTMRFVLALAMLGLVAGAAVQAKADLIYSNFGASPGYLGTYQPYEFYQGTGVPQSIAVEFSSTSSFVFDQAKVALQLISGTDNVLVSIDSDSGGHPGAALESITLSALVLGTPEVLTAASSSHPMLNAGMEYWLVVAAGARPKFQGQKSGIPMAVNYLCQI